MRLVSLCKVKYLKFVILIITLVSVISGCDKEQAASTEKMNVVAPKYLAIKDYKTCTSIESKGTWDAICMPSAQPKGCEDKTWKALQDTHELDTCSTSKSQ